MSTFQSYVKHGFTDDLLPIIPPGATLSASSEIQPELVGKIPGKLTEGGWVGFAKWREYTASPADIKRWDAWRPAPSIGLQGRTFVGLDIDVDEESLAVAIERLAVQMLGPSKCRFGRGRRRLLIYRCPGTPKRRIAFTYKGETHAVELLGDGQQYVLDGVHPKTGSPYVWRHGRPDAADVTAINPDQLDAFFAEAA